jgi:DNA topoisomerase-1
MRQPTSTLEQTAVNCAPAALAATADLLYVNDSEPGFRRRRAGRGFTYLDAQGKPVTSPALRKRFTALVIPPAWQDVWICAKPNGHLLVTGRDEAGRKQYIYHPQWTALRDQAKYERLRLFGEALPKLRTQVQHDLRKRTLTCEKVTALVVNLLEQTLIRVGNEEYARQNETYGLTTLQDDHVAVSGTAVSFEFRGKSGKDHEIALQDRRLARLVHACQELPGQHLFQYLDENDTVCGLTSTQVNEYLRHVSGCEFTAKDFRTWGGTVMATRLLHQVGLGDTPRASERNIGQVIKQVAEKLGNTPAVCRQHYVHPAILTAYLADQLPTIYRDVAKAHKQTVPDLAEDEAVVYTILSNTAR